MQNSWKYIRRKKFIKSRSAKFMEIYSYVDINARSSNPAPCYYQHQLLLLARINKSAKQSSTRVNNCVLYPMSHQSVTNCYLDCISCFNLHRNTSSCPAKPTTLGPRPARPILTRDRGGQRRRPTHPPR